ncbi:MAG: LCP family protein [Oscillospiraceae bacterium]|nr:LCP family protein [Oscillospiraceae bacterium]
MKDSGEKKSGGCGRIFLGILAILLALVLVVTACVGAYVNYLLSKMQRVELSDQSVISPSEVEEILGTDPDLLPIDPSESLPDLEDVTFPTEASKPVEKPKHIINILVIGLDKAESGTRARSDSMILVTVNTKSKAVTLTSFMRDSYVQIPGYKANKLNHAYQYGGMKLLNETLKVNFGVEVDGNLEINYEQFVEIIDMLGGVEITLTAKEAKFMRESKKWEDIQEGKNRLTGIQALSYARLRHIDSDYQRTERQRTVIMALVEAYKNLPVDQMLSLLEQLMSRVSTNMTDAQMWEYGLRVAPILAGARYTSQRLPVDGTFSQGIVQVRPGLKAWFQYNIDFETNRELMREIFEE